MPIRQYAEKHGLTAETVADRFAEISDADVSPDDEVPIKDLDDMRESIYEMAIEQLVISRDELDDARQTVRSAEDRLRSDVRDALLDGVPAARVAMVLGVSRARVYQIRDGKR